jgi:helicase
VIDEFHLIDDHGRGPTLEIIISRTRHENPNCQIIALSATVGNANKVAEWLDAKLVTSEWRPVELRSGTFSDLILKIHRVDSKNLVKLPNPRAVAGNPNHGLRALISDTLSENGQALVFVNSRASAQKEARELSKHLIRETKKKEGISTEKISLWQGVSTKLVAADENTSMGKALSDCVAGGVGFHHAGLSPRQRDIVEEAFKEGVLVALVATPTLAQGVNLPSRRVIVRDHRRWNSTAGGSLPIRAMEIRQMMGRAGRPGYDPHGEGIVIAKNPKEEQFIVDRYILGTVEPVTSRLATIQSAGARDDPALLTHMLALIATGGIDNRYSLSKFLSKTFLASTIPKEGLEERIDRSIGWLVENEMISRTGEDENLAERISESVEDEDVVDLWDDDVPNWAMAAKGIVDLEKVSDPMEYRKGLSNRKGPAIFGFSRASSIEKSQLESVEALTMTYSATMLGRSVARLYLSPLSGRALYDGLIRASQILNGIDAVGQISPFSLVHLVTSTADFQKFWVKGSEIDQMEASSIAHEREKLLPPDPLDELECVKSTLILMEWMEEAKMADLERRWGVQPGDLRSRVEAAEWLLRASIRILSDSEHESLSDLTVAPPLLEILKETRTRLQHGCKPDIIPLVGIRGVGRSRARDLVNRLSVESVRDVASMTNNDLEKLGGLQGWSTTLASNIRKEASRIVK